MLGIKLLMIVNALLPLYYVEDVCECTQTKNLS